MIDSVANRSLRYRPETRTVRGMEANHIGVRRLDHVAVRRADPERTATWYAAVLGLERRLDGAFGADSPVTVGVGECSLSIFPGFQPSFEHLAFEVTEPDLEAATGIL